MRVQAKIQKWGNSLALRLTGSIKTIPHFTSNMVVDVEITSQGIKVSPSKKMKNKLFFSEKDLLKGLTPYKAHIDEVIDISDAERGE